ncbi:MAG TPA: hypothetical protein VIC57_02585 [Candidatus Dormibacteraeota bacterium]
MAALGAVLMVAAQATFGAPAPVAAAAPAQNGHPNRADLSAGTRSVSHLPAPPKAPAGPRPPDSPPPIPKVPMQPGLVSLDPVSGAHFTGSDGVLEVTAPAGAVTAADVAAAGGTLRLLVRQVEPGSGSSAGGSGHVSFGTWLVQVVDAAGRPAARGLRQPLSVKLHESGRAGALDLRNVGVVVNPPLPSWVDLNPSSVPAVTAASGARQATPKAPSSPAARPALGAMSRQRATLEAGSTTLSTSLLMTGPNAAASFDTNAVVATFGRPDPFETDLSAGALSAGIQLDVPAGPGGLTPPLTLAYNSSGVNDQHNAQGGAPWVGEGWSLGLGAISWAEHQVDMTGCQQCTQTQWEDSWQLSDPFGTAAELVAPDVTVSTYTDDSGNAITPSPVVWHTAPESRARVISFSSGIGMPGGGPVATTTAPPTTPWTGPPT